MSWAREAAPLMVLLVVLAAAPFVVGESDVFLLTDFLITALFAMSFNLLLGQAGMLSFGHAAFYGLGAYTVALLYSKLGVPIVPGFLAAPIVSGLVALAVGFFVVRLEGMYFAMLTLAFAQLIFSIISNWYSFTGGDNGLPVPPPDWLLPTNAYYFFTLALVALCIGLLFVIHRSAFGAALAATRENAQRSAYLGLDVRRYQLAAFVLAGAFAGVAGSLRAPLQQMAFPSLLYWTQSADPVLMALIGGVGTFIGPIVGAALFVFVTFIVTSHAEYPLLAFGALVLVLVLFLPKGIVGTLTTWRLQRARPNPAQEKKPANPLAQEGASGS
jgi:branched-chain amino acid transport system permease protein